MSNIRPMKFHSITRTRMTSDNDNDDNDNEDIQSMVQKIIERRIKVAVRVPLLIIINIRRNPTRKN